MYTVIDAINMLLDNCTQLIDASIVLYCVFNIIYIPRCKYFQNLTRLLKPMPQFVWIYAKNTCSKSSNQKYALRILGMSEKTLRKVLFRKSSKGLCSDFLSYHPTISRYFALKSKLENVLPLKLQKKSCIVHVFLTGCIEMFILSRNRQQIISSYHSCRYSFSI